MTAKDDGRSAEAPADKQSVEPQDATAQSRRSMLKRLGRFAAVTAPAVTLLLATTKLAKASP